MILKLIFYTVPNLFTDKAVYMFCCLSRNLKYFLQTKLTILFKIVIKKMRKTQ